MTSRSREDVMSAFMELAQETADFKLVSRKFKAWEDCNNTEFPALFVLDHSETHVRMTGMGEGLPVAATINATAIIYVRDEQADKTIPPATQLNNMLDAFEATIAPSPLTLVQTLGGRVRHVWIEGEVFKEPGDVDGQGIIVIPLKILVP